MSSCSQAPRSRVAGTVLAMVVLLAACSASRSANPPAVEVGSSATRPAGRLVPAHGVLVGAYVAAADTYADDARREDVLRHEQAIGRSLDISHDFYDWPLAWNVERANWNLNRGVTPLITWFGGPAEEILAGDHDDWIRQQAGKAREIRGEFFLRFFHEMDGARAAELGYGGDDGPRRFIAVWNRVRDIFAEENVTDAIWVWNPTNGRFSTGRAQQYYPGDAVVDWIGSDPYLWIPCRADSYESFGQRVADFLEWAEGRPKPIMFGEWGAGHDPRDEQRQFIASMADTLAAHPNIAAIVYFNTPGKAHEGQCRWQVEDDPDTLETYRRLVNDPAILAS